MFRRLLVPLFALGITTSLSAQQPAPEKIDDAMNAKIRAEGTDRSKIMWIEHYLTDVYGPRLTGSPSAKQAGDWAVKALTGWGLSNAGMEKWAVIPSTVPG